MYYDDDFYDERIPELLLNSKVRRARIEHTCSTCPRTILPGQHYEAEFWLVDGEPTYVKTCPVCLDYKYGTVAMEVDELLACSRRTIAE